MRLALSSLLVLLLFVGCQSSSQSSLQNRIDSLERVNQSLEREARLLRDSLRSANPSEQTLSPPVYFPSGSAWLFNEAKERLDQHAQTLKQKYPDAGFRIKGYTDSVPIGPTLQDTYPSNWYLSSQRAAAVAHYLDKEHDIRTKSLEIEAFGSKAPVAPNETSQGRRQNRRVEIVVEDAP